MKLTFSKMRDVSDLIRNNQEEKFCDFLNSFEGKSIVGKFKNILQTWDYHVSYEFTITSDSKKINLPLDYIISQLTNDLDNDVEFTANGFDIVLQTPLNFEISEEKLPIYSIIKSVSKSGVGVQLNDLSNQDRKNIIDVLPAQLYTDVLHYILNDQSKILQFDNLKNFKFNFYTFDVYGFLKNIFGNYTRDYFQDITFHLSKKIGYDAIVNSDLRDIEYYITKYNEELENQKKTNSTID